MESTLYSVRWSTFGFVHWCCTGFIDFQVQRVEIVEYVKSSGRGTLQVVAAHGSSRDLR